MAALELHERRRAADCARYLVGGDHAGASVGVELAELEVTGLLVEEDVDSRERNLALVARVQAAEARKRRVEAKLALDLDVGTEGARELVHDAVHGLRGVAEQLDRGLVEDLGREGPRRGLAVVEGVRAGKVLVAKLAARKVTAHVANGLCVLVLERARVQDRLGRGHGFLLTYGAPARAISKTRHYADGRDAGVVPARTAV